MEKKLHITKADIFFLDLDEKSKTARNDPSVEVVCFDYQQNLPLPVVPEGDVFYSRQLWVFNQCYYSGASGKSKMYMFDELECKKGANETISFLDHYIKNFIPATVKKLYLFSDNCAGQQKNMSMVYYLSALAISQRFEEIYHHFPERGHSFLPCDRQFALIGNKKKGKEYIFIPEQYFSLVENASKQFQVINVQQPMIKDFKSLLETFFKKKAKSTQDEAFTISIRSSYTKDTM